jgi:hypothetical protein
MSLTKLSLAKNNSIIQPFLQCTFIRCGVECRVYNCNDIIIPDTSLCLFGHKSVWIQLSFFKLSDNSRQRRGLLPALLQLLLFHLCARRQIREFRRETSGIPGKNTIGKMDTKAGLGGGFYIIIKVGEFQ